MKFLADVMSVSKVRLYFVTLLTVLNINSFGFSNGSFVRNDNGTYLVESNKFEIKITNIEDDSFEAYASVSDGELVTNLTTSFDNKVFLVGMFVGSLEVQDEFVAYNHFPQGFYLVINELNTIEFVGILEEGLIPVEFVTSDSDELNLKTVRVEDIMSARSIRVGRENVEMLNLSNSWLKFNTGTVPEHPETDDPDGVTVYSVGTVPEHPETDDPDGVTAFNKGIVPEHPETDDPDGVTAFNKGIVPEHPETDDPDGVTVFDMSFNSGTVPEHPETDDPDGKRAASASSQTFNLVQIPGVGQVLIIR